MAEFTFGSEAAYDEAIRTAQVEADKADSELGVTRHEYDHDPEIEELSMKLEALKKPYEAKIDQQNEHLGKLRNHLATLKSEKQAFKEAQTISEADEKGEMWEESVEAFLNLHKIKQYGTEIKFKKQLSNGIKAYQEKPSKDEYHDWNKLFLFKGTALVGFWCKRKSEHPGDDTVSKAWIGVKILTEDEPHNYMKPEESKKGNDIEETEFTKLAGYYNDKKKHVFYRETGRYSSRTDPTIKQFLDYAENFKENLVAIDVTDHGTIDILHEEPS